MREKGFTLIEILGVIIIIGLLLVIAFPKIVNFTNNSLSKTDELMKDMIYKATDLYIKDNSTNFEKVNGAIYCIELSKLVKGNYLESPIKISDEDITYSHSVKVTYRNEYDFELIDSNSCTQS